MGKLRSSILTTPSIGGDGEKPKACATFCVPTVAPIRRLATDQNVAKDKFDSRAETGLLSFPRRRVCLTHIGAGVARENSLIGSRQKD